MDRYDFLNYPTSKELLIAILLLVAIIRIVVLGHTLFRGNKEPASLWDKFYKANPPKHEGELFDDIYNQD